MTVFDITQDVLKKAITDSLNTLKENEELSFEEIPEFILERPREKEHGDFSTNCAMLMARAVVRNKAVVCDLGGFRDPITAIVLGRVVPTERQILWAKLLVGDGEGIQELIVQFGSILCTELVLARHVKRVTVLSATPKIFLPR